MHTTKFFIAHSLLNIKVISALLNMSMHIIKAPETEVPILPTVGE